MFKAKKSNTTTAKTPRRRRVATGLVLTAVAVGSAGFAVSPAQTSGAEAATIVTGFRVFYSPGCTGASRWYPGLTSENWINDAFNSTYFGSAGNGQGIRNNAGSISVNNARVDIGSDELRIQRTYATTGNEVCFDIGNLRNNNTYWVTRAY